MSLIGYTGFPQLLSHSFQDKDPFWFFVAPAGTGLGSQVGKCLGSSLWWEVSTVLCSLLISPFPVVLTEHLISKLSPPVLHKRLLTPPLSPPLSPPLPPSHCAALLSGFESWKEYERSDNLILSIDRGGNGDRMRPSPAQYFPVHSEHGVGTGGLSHSWSEGSTRAGWVRKPSCEARPRMWPNGGNFLEGSSKDMSLKPCN